MKKLLRFRISSENQKIQLQFKCLVSIGILICLKHFHLRIESRILSCKSSTKFSVATFSMEPARATERSQTRRLLT